MRIYFRTLKARQVRTSRGKQAETIMKQRRRQRMINVSHLFSDIFYALNPYNVFRKLIPEKGHLTNLQVSTSQQRRKLKPF